jgi:hypothetical protein
LYTGSASEAVASLPKLLRLNAQMEGMVAEEQANCVLFQKREIHEITNVQSVPDHFSLARSRSGLLPSLSERVGIPSRWD